MSSKKNNKDGKQFSSEYQPPTKWTEKKALKLGAELLAWIKDKEENIFFEEFLLIENDYYPTLIAYLKNKYQSFSKLLVTAKKIQEIKLVKYGVMDKLNSTMTKFVLINIHDWKDKKEIDNTTDLKIKEVDLSKENIKSVLDVLKNEY